MKNCPELQFVKKKKKSPEAQNSCRFFHSTPHESSSYSIHRCQRLENNQRRLIGGWKKKTYFSTSLQKSHSFHNLKTTMSPLQQEKKKRSVRDTKQEVHSQPDAHPSFKALTKLLITQLAAGDTNAGRGETKKKVKWHLIDAHVVLKVECQSSLWASLSLSCKRSDTHTEQTEEKSADSKNKKKKLATI